MMKVVTAPLGNGQSPTAVATGVVYLRSRAFRDGSTGMPTILCIRGWRLFFYSNEGHEPVHVHATKGGGECKFWLRQELYDIEEAWSHGLTPRLRKEIRRIIFENFDLILEEWQGRFGEQDHAED
jgi:hypothetical protein